MTPRKPAPDPLTGNGDLATFARFKDKLLVGFVGLAVAAMGLFIRSNAAELASIRVDFHNDLVEVRAEVAELRTRLTADQNASTGQFARFGAQGEEALRRLDRIDKKLDVIAGPRR